MSAGRLLEVGATQHTCFRGETDLNRLSTGEDSYSYLFRQQELEQLISQFC